LPPQEQAFSFKTRFLARLNVPFNGGLCESQVDRLAAKQQTGVETLCPYITAHGPPTWCHFWPI